MEGWGVGGVGRWGGGGGLGGWEVEGGGYYFILYYVISYYVILYSDIFPYIYIYIYIPLYFQHIPQTKTSVKVGVLTSFVKLFPCLSGFLSVSLVASFAQLPIACMSGLLGVRPLA